jgi:integrase
LRAIDGYEGTLTVRCALQLAPLVFVHPGELHKAEWKDIDLGAAEWRYIVTKTNTPHIVPLSLQAVVILRELQPLTGNGRFVFPGARTKSGFALTKRIDYCLWMSPSSLNPAPKPQKNLV